MLFRLIVALLLGIAPAWAGSEPGVGVGSVTTQERFERSVKRVGAWVGQELGETEPLTAGVVVLPFEAFLERAGQIPGWEPGFAAAWDDERREIVVNADTFAVIAGGLTKDGFFEDDAAGLLLAQQLTYAVQARRMGPLTPLKQVPEDEREGAAVRRAVRFGHGLLVQHRYARWVDGEKLEKASRALMASPEWPAGVRVAVAGEAFLARVHGRDGAEGVWAALAEPPADMAALLRGGTDAPPDGSSLAEMLVEAAGPGKWVPVSRAGVAQAIGSSWGWLPAATRAEIEESVEDAFSSAAIKRAAGPPTMLSVSVLRFREEDAARAAPEKLDDAIMLMASRFDYTPQSEKRDSTPVERDGLDGWRVVSGDHPLPDGTAGFGVFAYRVIGRHLVLVNGMGVPEDDEGVKALLEKIAGRFQAH
jgi:hypothetical protein